ncbi:T6SS immunity protein Tdi1 domain-containing protein [Novosphingobium naphthalenivorans]|uniref:T6SS immunity protein Tdi1 domain-containing protein n=1 Tax=Novosphingobium naphthalenivorans TaxID=273168 RepID=UPI000830A4DE|nr:T6SS immunity protein Tdi1 domain-containing protein [Novosphingobium naphthalenivorans]
MKRAMQALRRDWGWTGVSFEDIIAVSPMGHVLVADTAGAIHYLDPETRELIRLGSEAQAAQYMADPEVACVWRAEALVAAARERLGAPEDGEVYTRTPEALIAGDYAHENLIRLPLAELLSFSGQVACQTQDLPEGTPIQLKVPN